MGAFENIDCLLITFDAILSNEQPCRAARGRYRMHIKLHVTSPIARLSRSDCRSDAQFVAPSCSKYQKKFILSHKQGDAMRFARSACFVFVVALGLVAMTIKTTAVEERYKAQIDTLRKSMEKYKDYKVAVRYLYLSTVGCVHYSGEKMAGHMHYPKGAMGIHFVNLTIRGAPDPMKPNVLIYEP